MQTRSYSEPPNGADQKDNVGLTLLEAEAELSNDGIAKHHIPGLDGLRAIAIATVMVAHNFEFNAAGAFGSVAGRMGTSAVHLFFALSGYLITSRLAADVAAYNPASALKAFYLRRIYRILPPLIPYLAVLTACGSFGLLPIRSSEIVAAALFASNYIQNKSWYTSHFWSLSAEEHFYLLWAPMLAFIGLRRSQAAVVAIIVLTIITRPIFISHSGLNHARLLEQTHLQLDFFGYASLFALWMRSSKFRLMADKAANHLVILAVVCLLALSAVRLPSLDTRTIQACLFGILVLLLSSNSKLMATRVLENRAIAWVGKRSYGIYIWQQIIFAPVTTTMSLFVLLPLRTAAVLVVAGLSFKYLEEPLLRKAHLLSRQMLAGNERGETALGTALLSP